MTQPIKAILCDASSDELRSTRQQIGYWFAVIAWAIILLTEPPNAVQAQESPHDADVPPDAEIDELQFRPFAPQNESERQKLLDTECVSAG